YGRKHTIYLIRWEPCHSEETNPAVKWIAILLLIIAGAMAILNRYDLTILIVVGVWAAYSYSLPPLQLSYRPFFGEWLSLFPAIFFFGFVVPWVALDTIPLCAYPNVLV